MKRTTQSEVFTYGVFVVTVKRLGRVIGCNLVFLAAVQAALAGVLLPGEFHFPPLESDRSLSLKAEGTETDRPPQWKARMVVDGTLTESLWPEHPPTVYRLSKHAYLFDDQYSGWGDYVWDAVAKKLTPIGRCSLHRVPGLGMMVVRYPDDKRTATEILDFPNEDGRPRVLLNAGKRSLAALGVWEGALVLVAGTDRLIVMEPGWPVKEIELDLGEFNFWTNGDGIRRGKVLLLGKLPKYSNKGRTFTYTVPVAVFNLKSRELKTIGRIPGGWSMNTAIPHPRVSVIWITQKEADKLQPYKIKSPFLGGSISYVIEETDQIVE